LAILNVCFGTKVNETLSKMLSILLTARLGESVAVTTDPYRIIIDLPRDIKPDMIIETLKGIRSDTVESLVRLVIKNSSHMRWRFVYVAKKFGAVDKDADYKNVNFSRLVEAYENSPMFEEAIGKVLWEDFDLDGTVEVVRRIESGDLEFQVCGLTPIGRAGLSHSKELITPQRADHSILMALKKRLEEEQMHMSCLNCSAQWRLRIREAPKALICPKCGGHMIAALNSYNKDLVKLVKKKGLSEDEEKELRKLFKNASLVLKNGKKAMTALAGRGIGPDTAGRVLAGFYDNEDDFLRDILSAEVNYAKTKRFWD
jgi:ATP-dependent Lhr-like helicase